MFPGRANLPPIRARVATVLIAEHPDLGATEAVIEGIRHHGARVEVTLLFGDGSGGAALLAVDDWNWLELSLGDIVPVRPLLSGGLSA